MSDNRSLSRFNLFVFLSLATFLGGCDRVNLSPAKVPALSFGHFNHLLVTTSDYQSGILVGIDLLQREVESLKLPIHSDAIVRLTENTPYFYVVNRLGADNVQWGRAENREILGQFSVGRGSNPQDIAVLNSTTAYVSRLESKLLLKVNPSSGSFLKEIDLFAGADSSTTNSTDPDGLPEMTWMRLVGEKLLVLLLRLNSEQGYEPSNKSQMAVLDTRTDQVERILTLKGTNPITEIKKYGSQFVLGESGKLGVLDGGIELINGDYQSLGWITDERKLGGDIIDCGLLDDDRGIAIVAKDIYGSEPSSQLVVFRTKDGQVTRVLKTGEKYSLHQILIDEERQIFFLSDRQPKRPGIWVFDSKTLEPVFDEYYQTGLPPYHMVLGE